MFRKIIALILLSVGLILPWRLRCLYIEGLGWITQFFYLSYVVLLKYILTEIRKGPKAQIES